MEEFNIIKFLKSAVASKASDEHLQVGYPPFIRKNGFIFRTNMPALTKEVLDNAVIEITPQNLQDTILSKCDIDFMYEIPGVSRFRVNYNRQMNKPGLVIRNIPYTIPTLKELQLPNMLESILDHQNGIILITGPTGCGKSTTIASLVNHINTNKAKHIVTIEDPIEYVFNSKKSILSQRQVGTDTESFSDGIKYALRQDPDVIFIGEIRDKETMAAALKASETGHLVLTTLHTNDAVQTINRIVDMFEESNRPIIRKQLAEVLRATVAQKLIYSEANKMRYPACEVMVVTPTIKDYINKDNLDEIYSLLRENNIDDMISLNSSLAELVSFGLISEEEAIENSNDASELKQLFRGVYQGTKSYYE